MARRVGRLRDIRTKPADAIRPPGQFVRYCPIHHTPTVESVSMDIVWCEKGEKGGHRVKRPLVVEGKTGRVCDVEDDRR